MKIFAVGRNYAEHISELNNERPEEPVIFSKPETAIIKKGKPFFYPEFSKDIHFEVELVILIGKHGKHIDERFAHKYYDKIGLGIDFTARDVQNKLKAKGLPWDLAKGFDGSAPISEFIDKSEFKDLGNINFRLEQNGETRQTGNSSLMLFSFDHIISFVSKHFTLKKGDLIFTGTPKGVGPVNLGDKLEGYLEDQKVLEVNVR